MLLRSLIAVLAAALLLLTVLVNGAQARPLFTHPPTDIADVGGVIPLGNVSPASNHTLPVDHMYIQFAVPNTGDRTSAVYAMGTGKIVMVTRGRHNVVPYDYQLYIKHNRYVTSYVDHVYELSSNIKQYLESTGSGWIDVDGAGFQVMFLGQRGAPSQFPVGGGDKLGETRNFYTSWDVGVIDTRARAPLLGKGMRRYPTVKDYFKLLGYPNVRVPYRGQQTINSVSFIKYMTPQLRSIWFDLLLSEPKHHGQAGWDVEGRLRGSWFNPAVDNLKPAPLFDLEYGAISITPYNLAPGREVQIALPQGHELALLDREAQYPQLSKTIVLDINTDPVSRVNPNPAKVTVRTGTVCYDVPYKVGSTSRFNTLLFKMISRRRVAVKLNPQPLNSPDCLNRLSDQPDSSWHIYRR